MKIVNSHYLSFSIVCSVLFVLIYDAAMAKSLYVIADINSRPSPVHTYDIQNGPNFLEFQAEQTVTAHCGGAVGLAIDGTNSKLFITYECSNIIELVDAVNFENLGSTTAVNATNLAGISVDQSRKKVYTIDRDTNHLYVYNWDSNNNTLSLVPEAPIFLAGITGAYGLALDETRGRLFVAQANTTTIRYFDIETWEEVGNFNQSLTGQTSMGIAVDSKRNFVYTGNAYPGYGSKGQLVKYDLTTNTESFYTLPTATYGDNIVGIAVDESSGYVYVTTGNQGSGGSDAIITFDMDLNVLNIKSLNGDPTGIAIPSQQVSYNPLNFSKNGILSGKVSIGSNFAYNINFNSPSVNLTGVKITDNLPPELDYLSNSGNGTYDSETHSIVWNIGNINVGADLPLITLNVKVNNLAQPGTTLFNHCKIESDQFPPTTVIDQDPDDPSDELGVNIDESAEKHVVLIIVDGLRKDVLDEALQGFSCPNLKFLFKDTAHVKYEQAHTIFPSVTFPANASLITGTYPNKHGITGNIWYDRIERNDRKYADVDIDIGSIGKDLIDVWSEDMLAVKDLQSDTIYDYLADHSKSFLINFHMYGSKHYADDYEKYQIWQKPIFGDLIYFGAVSYWLSETILKALDIPKEVAYAWYDQNMFFDAVKKINEKKELPNLLTLYFAGHDGNSHIGGIKDQITYLRDIIDPLIGNFINGGNFTRNNLHFNKSKPSLSLVWEENIEFVGIKNIVNNGVSNFDETVFIIVSDHGQSDVVNKANASLKLDSQLSKNGGMTQIYVQNKYYFDSWTDKPRFAQDVLELAKKYWNSRIENNIEHILVRDSESGDSWNTNYYLYRWDDNAKRHNPNWLNFGSIVNQRINNISSQRSGDIILLAKEGTSFVHKRGEADHGNIHENDSQIPLIFSSRMFFETKDINTVVSIVDIAPTILKILGIQMNGSDGTELSDVTSVTGK